jgi:alkylation response protein AidB-like acyl-CoA dehydrogenase
VFFEDVRVPKDNVVGEVDKGWTVAKALLGYERDAIGSAMGSQLVGVEQSLVELARRHLESPSGALPGAEVRADIARFGMDEQCFGFTLERISQAREGGKAPGAESSVVKVAGSELKQRRWELAMRIAGPESAGWEGPGFDAECLQMTRDWLRSRGNTIEGGTSEVQLNIIAKRVLGLPQ